MSAYHTAVDTASKPEAKAGEKRKLRLISTSLTDVEQEGVIIPNARADFAFEVLETRTIIKEQFPIKAYGNIKEASLQHHAGRMGDLMGKIGLGADEAQAFDSLSDEAKNATDYSAEFVLYRNDRGYLTVIPPLEAPATAPRRTAEEQSAALIAG